MTTLTSMTTSPSLTTLGASPTLSSCHPQDLPWVPWAMPGAAFKLLSVEPSAQRFSLLIKVAANAPAPRHRHVGAVEGMVLEGGFFYDDAPETIYQAGTYLLERAGAVHRPVSRTGAVMFLVFHGAIEGLNEADEVIGKIDWRWHEKAWKSALIPHITEDTTLNREELLNPR